MDAFLRSMPGGMCTAINVPDKAGEVGAKKKPIYTPGGLADFLTLRIARMAVAAQQGLNQQEQQPTTKSPFRFFPSSLQDSEESKPCAKLLQFQAFACPVSFCSQSSNPLLKALVSIIDNVLAQGVMKR
eukprot:6473441-Amphidinium_carterae.2